MLPFRHTLLCLILGLGGFTLLAQDHYYWTPEGKVPLVEDRSTLVLHFERKITPDAVLDPGMRSGIVDRDARRPSRESLVLDLAATAYASPAEAARHLLRAGSPLRSAAFGFRIGGGMVAWPTHRIVYRPGAAFDSGRLAAVLAPYAGIRAFRTPGGIEGVEVADIADALPLANILYETGMFDWCHPDLMATLRAQSGQSLTSPTSCAPSDPLFAGAPQFYLDNPGGTFWFEYPYYVLAAGMDIDAPKAWCLTTGDAQVTVAIIDEGVEDHEDLMDDALAVSRVLPGYTVSDPVNGVGAPEFNEDAHGQAVAGVIAASHNTLGISGIAPEVRILPIHIFTDGSTSAADIADAVNWAWQNGADVINNSWVYDTCVSALFPVIEQAIDDATTLGRGGLGCLMVFSSGSEFDVSCVGYPATRSNVLAVGAVGPDGVPPNYASKGPELDLVGVSSPDLVANVTIMDRMGVLGYNDGFAPIEQYSDPNYSKWFGGTSVTAAQVSGVAALMLSVDYALSRSAITSILLNTAVDMGPAGFDNTYGHGRVNAFAAVSAAMPVTFPVEWLSFEGAVVGDEIVLDWTTAAEVNNDRFVVERRQGSDFVPIGEVAAVGNSQEPVAYRFFDQQPETGRNVYRLQQVDFDGQVHYGPQVEVSFPLEGISALFPNPAETETAFRVYGRRGEQVSWWLYDGQGRLLRQAVWTVATGTDQGVIHLGDLPAGTYLVRIETSRGDRRSLRLQRR